MVFSSPRPHGAGKTNEYSEFQYENKERFRANYHHELTVQAGRRSLGLPFKISRPATLDARPAVPSLDAGETQTQTQTHRRAAYSLGAGDTGEATLDAGTSTMGAGASRGQAQAQDNGEREEEREEEGEEEGEESFAGTPVGVRRLDKPPR